VKDLAKGYTPKKKPSTKKKTTQAAQASSNKQTKRPAQNKKNQQKMILLIAVIVLFIILALFLMAGNDTKKPSNTTIEAPTHDTGKIITVDTATTSPSEVNIKSIPLDTISDKSTSPSTEIITKGTPVSEQLETNHKTSEITATANATAATTSLETTPNQTKETENTEPKFTFYSNLTHETVPVDVAPQAIRTYKTTYMLQVGSYRSQSAVNSARARLLLLGLKPVVSKQGDWYRLDVGPVYSKRDGDIIKHKLEANQISGSMLRQVSKVEIKPETDEKK
jgi:cell division protein FtsN